MLICPDCRELLSEPDLIHCEKCDWRGEKQDGVPIYLSSHDRTDPVFQVYMKNYERIADDDLMESILDEHYLENQAANLADSVRNIRGAAVCDIGCGKGYLARALLARGADSITVVDISLAYLRRLSGTSRIRPVLANAENLPFRDTFDIVVSTDVMEHVLGVGSFLHALNRALRSDGRAYIRVPYNENLLKYSGDLGYPYRFVHLRSFDKLILRNYFGDAGFRVERFRYDGFWMNSPWPFWTRTILRRCGFKLFLRWAKTQVQHPTDITRWRNWFVGIFLRPAEITVAVRKQRETVP